MDPTVIYGYHGPVWKQRTRHLYITRVQKDFVETELIIVYDMNNKQYINIPDTNIRLSMSTVYQRDVSHYKHNVYSYKNNIYIMSINSNWL